MSYFALPIQKTLHSLEPPPSPETRFTDDQFEEKSQESWNSIILSDFLERTFHRLEQELTIEYQFQSLVQSLNSECRFVSSIDDIAQHRACLEIIEIGRDVLPLILRQLRQSPAPWHFIALGEITKENPVHSQNRGNIDKMAHDWLEWANLVG